MVFRQSNFPNIGAINAKKSSKPGGFLLGRKMRGRSRRAQKKNKRDLPKRRTYNGRGEKYLRRQK
jgi:hypothetical protein